MTDVLRGLASGSALIFGWIAPTSIAAGAFALFIYPSTKHLPILRSIDALPITQRSLVFALSIVLLGLLLNAFDTPLYRLLEGYLGWPKWLQASRIKRRSQEKRRLEELAQQDEEGWQQGLVYEALERYPIDEKQLTPTRLGNAIRSFETYGVDRYNLDSQAFWSELLSVVSEDLRRDYDQARAAVDFFVCLLYLSGMFGVAAVAAAIGTELWTLLIAALIAFSLIPVCYRLAYLSTSSWGEATKAIVNVGRKGLAAALGLKLPQEIREERRMWGLMNEFVFYPFDTDMATLLDPYRLP